MLLPTRSQYKQASDEVPMSRERVTDLDKPTGISCIVHVHLSLECSTSWKCWLIFCILDASAWVVGLTSDMNDWSRPIVASCSSIIARFLDLSSYTIYFFKTKPIVSSLGIASD